MNGIIPCDLNVFHYHGEKSPTEWKSLTYRDLRPEQQRQLIDSVELYESWSGAKAEQRRRYAGSMRWVTRNGRDYLLRKVGAKETSLGPRTAESEQTYGAFVSGRDRNRKRLAALASRLDEMAPINRAMGLGRVPRIAARVLREIEQRELLGSQLYVVGTNALFAYEARAGVRIESSILATGDVDLMFDARQRLSLVGRQVKETGLLGILRRLDRSFQPRRPGDFRATNKVGYHVDLIRPESRDAIRGGHADALSVLDDDLRGSPIDSLAWLVNAPRFRATAMGDDGYPLPMVCIDPRVFALHKAWISNNPHRDPLKRQRDLLQARTSASIARSRLGLSFDERDALSVLPAAVRDMLGLLLADEVGGKADRRDSTTPDW